MSYRSVAVVVLSMLPLVARADWTKWSDGDSSVYLNAVSAPDLNHVFVAGDWIQVAGQSVTMHPRMYASSDRGHTFTDLSGPLGNTTGIASTSAISFVDAKTGWIGIGAKLYKTTDGGAHWSPSGTLSGNTTALQAFDDMDIARVGTNSAADVSTNGGTSWVPGSGVDAGLTFVRMFWLDREHGWAASNYVDTNQICTEAELFRTTDGGSTWTETWTQSGQCAGPLFFLKDGRTGWVSTYEQTNADADPPDPYTAKVHLFKTTNGGDDLTDTALPVQVGHFATFNTPVYLARLWAMYWDDEQHGHMVGGAFLGSATGGSSGGMTSVMQTTTAWRVADYVTTDGTSWTKPNYTITSSGLSLPASDGQFTTGFMADSANGWHVADSQAVWGYEKRCTAPGECAAGYTCTDGHCVDETPQTPFATDGGPASGQPDAGHFSLGDKSNDSVRTGCQCGQASTAGAVALLAMAVASRRGRRAARR